MNKQLPEDIMKKIKQEAKERYTEPSGKESVDSKLLSLEDLRIAYIAGRTASVQPLIDSLQKISDRKRSLVLPFDAYKDKDEARKMCVALNDIDELATEALSSFPSSPNNTGKWIDVKKELPDYDDYVLWYFEDGTMAYSELDKDGNPWLYGETGMAPATHWKRIEPPKQ